MTELMKLEMSLWYKKVKEGSIKATPRFLAARARNFLLKFFDFRCKDQNHVYGNMFGSYKYLA